MAGSTTNHGIGYPEAADLVKDPATPSKLAADIRKVAVGADNALAVVEYRAKVHADDLDRINRTNWTTGIAGSLAESKEYTDVSFEASGPGGATDAQVDAAVSRGVLAGRVADQAKLPSGGRVAVGRGDFGALASDYGANADGVSNDFHRIQEAIDNARGKPVYVDGGRTYLIAGTLRMPTNSDSVKIVALGSSPAIFKVGASGQSYSPVKFEQTTVSASTTLTDRVRNGQHGWQVASTAGIVPGMLCEVISSTLWYFDPRPGVGEARKSELHKVKDTFLGKVYFEDPANEGYDTMSESVTLEFFTPIKVHMENILVLGTLPGVAEETNAIIGVEVHHADNPTLLNVSVDSCARTGIYLNRCYRPVVHGGYTRRANNFYNGYGVSTSGTAHALVKDRMSFECRRSVDFSGSAIISRMNTAENCTAVGGGVNSRGIEYGWKADGTQGADQYGFGTHGPADHTRYISCTTVGIMRPYSLRGRDEVIEDLRHIGRTNGGVIQLGYGTNLFVRGGIATSGSWSYKNGAPYVTGQTQAHWRPDCFVRNYATYQGNVPTGTQRGRFIVKGAIAEVQNTFIHFFPQSSGALPMGHLAVADNDVSFWPTVAGATSQLLFLEGTDPGTSKAKWFIGPNRMSLDAGTGPIVTATNITMAGANVLNYTMSA